MIVVVIVVVGVDMRILRVVRVHVVCTAIRVIIVPLVLVGSCHHG